MALGQAGEDVTISPGNAMHYDLICPLRRLSWSSREHKVTRPEAVFPSATFRCASSVRACGPANRNAHKLRC